MTAVIRCVVCQGQSRIGVESLGELVICPHCDNPFLAVTNKPAPPPRTDLAQPLAPPKSLEDAAESLHPAGALPVVTLPASVLFGLALLPFIMPLSWTAARLISGWEPNVTLAVPISLALTAATLSLAVVSTVDWTAATRIKGVLMIVALAYFCGATLFFLKKDAIEWAKRQFTETPKWKEFSPPKSQVFLRVPGGSMQASGEQPIPGWNWAAFRIEHDDVEGHAYEFAHGTWVELQAGENRRSDWLSRALTEMKKAAGNNDGDVNRRPSDYRQHPGWEWTLPLPDGTQKVVRVCHVGNKLYYMAVVGPNLTSDSPAVRSFFDSFRMAHELP